MNQDTLKRKLRALKKFETKTRFGETSLQSGAQFVWDRFFGRNEPKYTAQDLLGLSREELKSIYDAFFAEVYFRYYSENGITFSGNFDAALLEEMDLPYDAQQDDIKRRFRTLAKTYHPDSGGTSEEFIRLMKIYKALTEN